MNPLRLVLWALGVVLVIWGAWMLFFETGLSNWVSAGVLIAGIILFIGLAVMSFASSAATETHIHDRPERTVERERHVHHENRPVRRTRTTTTRYD